MSYHPGAHPDLLNHKHVVDNPASSWEAPRVTHSHEGGDRDHLHKDFYGPGDIAFLTAHGYCYGCQMCWGEELIDVLTGPIFGWFPEVDFRRASGDAECPVCGKTLKEHPRYPLFPFLNIVCDGRLVKL